MNHTLVIHSVKTRDGGVYRCQAYNTRGSIEAPATLNVIGNKRSCVMKNLISLLHRFNIFLCPKRNFGRHIVIALSVGLSRFVSVAYLLYSLR